MDFKITTFSFLQPLIKAKRSGGRPWHSQKKSEIWVGVNHSSCLYLDSLSGFSDSPGEGLQKKGQKKGHLVT